MSTTKEQTITIPVGVEMLTFSLGDYLNAINAVTCYFQAQRECTDEGLASALRLYAESLDEPLP